MSTKISIFLISFAAVGCADPAARFGEFTDRVVDGSVNTIDASPLDEIPDISGDFLLAADPAPFPGSYFRFKATAAMTRTGDDVAVQLDFQPLHRMTGEPVGDAIPATPRMAAVSTTGEFEVRVMGVVPGEGNAISGTPVTIDLMVMATIRTEDYFCGLLNGGVVAPLTLDLNGSTFGAIRVPDGTDIIDLTPVPNCVDLDPADAGVPDAMPPDAMPANDAAVGDAAAADAS